MGLKSAEEVSRSQLLPCQPPQACQTGLLSCGMIQRVPGWGHRAQLGVKSDEGRSRISEGSLVHQAPRTLTVRPAPHSHLYRIKQLSPGEKVNTDIWGSPNKRPSLASLPCREALFANRPLPSPYTSRHSAFRATLSNRDAHPESPQRQT